MIHLGLLRHGEVEGGPRFRGTLDDQLTPEGLAQMWSALDGSPGWDRVYTSPLARCASFADAFARRHNLPLEREKRLREIHFGEWEGRSAAEIHAGDPDRLGRFWHDPERHPPPGGETLAAFRARVLEAWFEILQRHDGRRILIVSHGGVIRILLCHLLHRPAGDLLEIEVAYASLQVLQVNAGEPAFGESPCTIPASG